MSRKKKEASKNSSQATTQTKESFVEESVAVRDRINEVSPSFCLAKWYQVTIHLQNGHTHSCHHPESHKVELRELNENPSALHNTIYKKYQRHLMLKGERPSECDYCWRIEDAHKDNVSDRTIKSSEDWAMPFIDEATTLPWDHNFNPRYVEVSFGHGCNFKCIYCAPHISSSIMAEYQKHGHYNELPYFEVDNLKKIGLYPIPKDENNPYVDAFWKWWPDLVKDLRYFRITGGEPLINPNMFKFLEYIDQNPLPELTFSVNSNLGISDSQFKRFLDLMQSILKNKKVKAFDFFTSMDTYGAHAEYIREGLDYKDYLLKVRAFLTATPIDTKLIFMCTYNALSVPEFHRFLEDVNEVKAEFRDSNNHPRLFMDMSYLRHPSFLSLTVLTKDYWEIIERDLEFMIQGTYQKMGEGWLYTEYEVSKMERILKWAKSLEETNDRREDRKNFYTFIKEVDRRRSKNFEGDFPQMSELFLRCRDMYENDQDPSSTPDSA